MAFPLDIRTDLKLDGIWSDISSDVYQRDAKLISRGLRDQSTTADPASLQLTLNNRSGKYSRRNAMSTLFGKIGRNTQIRLSVPSDGDHYLQLDGVDDRNVTTPDGPAVEIPGDLDVRVEASTDWFSSRNQILIGKWLDTGDQRSWMLSLYRGLLYLRYSLDGTIAQDWFHAWPLPAEIPERAVVRATLDVDNGAGGRTVNLYWSTTMSGPWTLLQTSSQPGVMTLFNSTGPLTIGPHDDRDGALNPRHPFAGRMYRAEVRSGIGGTIIAAPDFRSMAPGAAPFTDSAGRLWTMAPGAEVRDREDRFVGEVSDWPLKWSTDDVDAWTSITASGLLRRMGQGQKPLDSTLRRKIPSGSPAAYWPMEESQQATQAYSPIPNVLPATVNGLEWGGFDTLVSSDPLPRIVSPATFNGPVPSAPAGAWQVEFVYTADGKMPPSAGAEAEVIQIRCAGGSARRWKISMKQGTGRVEAFDANDVSLMNTAIIVTDEVFDARWKRLRLWVSSTGGTITWRVDWSDIGGSRGGFGATFAGTAGYVTTVQANWGSLVDGWGVGHIAVFPRAGDLTFDGSDDAFTGEPAQTRMYRLALEEGFAVTRQAGPNPALVGYQRPDPVLTLVEAAADADGGLLTEDIRSLALRYRDRSSIYHQDPRLTLSYTAPGLGPDIEPVDDDTAVVNDVTVNRDAGSAGRAVLETGPLSVQDIGKYDTAVTLSLASDSQAEPIAYWKLSLGTFDAARYPTITINLHKPGAESLIPAILAMREGDKVRLTNLPEWVSHDDVDLIVYGWSEVLELHRWVVTLNCGPAGPWDTAFLNTIVEDFEDSTLNVTFTSAGALPWARSTNRFQYGSWSYRSGAITNNQDSDAILAIPYGARSLSFWYRTVSEPAGAGFTGDYLSVIVNGSEVLRASGDTPWTLRTLDVTGVSAVTFRYHKDNSSAVGDDSAYIDQVRIGLGQLPSLKAAASSSSLAAHATATALSLSVATASGSLWTTDPAQYPQDISVGGEVMRVTAVSGAVSPQTFTIGARSVNGVVKAHTAATAVDIASPTPVAL
ncbi:hypothetical protein [Streptomyces galilaeus]|uniref:hypothetical protein n=1 Tax=Streptomyces galilaeus TaxID=33899 RepID=UPI0038F809C3